MHWEGEKGGRGGVGRGKQTKGGGGARVSFLLLLNSPGRLCYITSLCVEEEDFVKMERRV